VADRFGLVPGSYVTCIARPEPENSVLEIVAGFSHRPRGCRLVVLGNFDPDRNPYHAAVRRAASAEVLFPGAIYDRTAVDALRLHAALHVHGHRVGGTNPSLVEALGAGNAVLAHDNQFNRWVAGPGAAYFQDGNSCAAAFDRLLAPDADLSGMAAAARDRHANAFVWQPVLAAYEALLTAWLPEALRQQMAAAGRAEVPGAAPAEVSRAA
jgi:glycosyltransferase involved in cell wall biosynthesis